MEISDEVQMNIIPPPEEKLLSRLLGIKVYRMNSFGPVYVAECKTCRWETKTWYTRDFAVHQARRHFKEKHK